MGAARRVLELFPTTEVRAYALARVQSVGDADVVHAPAIEYIRLRDGGCLRTSRPYS